MGGKIEMKIKRFSEKLAYAERDKKSHFEKSAFEKNLPHTKKEYIFL